MFDAKRALLAINGKSFNSVQLRLAFEGILVENIKDIPAEFRARDLFELAWNNGWLKEADGIYMINVPLETSEVQVCLSNREIAERLIDSWLK